MMIPARLPRGVRVERQREADEAVATQLQHHAGQDHRACRGRLHVRVRQPRVERPHGHLDGEGQEERQEGKELERAVEAVGAQRQVVEGALPGAGRGLEGEGRGQDGHQHQQRADERVEDELDRRVDAVGAAPDADDQVHRHQDDFPEDVEEEHVQGQEDAQHAHFQDQEGDHVLLHAVLDGLEAGQDADPRQRGGEQDQDQRDAVDADVVVDAEGRQPGRLLLELELRAAARVEAQHQEQRQHPHDQRHDQRRPADELHLLPREERDHQGAEERPEDDRAEDGQAGEVDHRFRGLSG